MYLYEEEIKICFTYLLAVAQDTVTYNFCCGKRHRLVQEVTINKAKYNYFAWTNYLIIQNKIVS